MKGLLLYLVLLLLVFFCFSIQAQENTKDKSVLHDLTNEAFKVYLSHPDNSINLSKQALALAQKTNDVYYEGYCYYLLSKGYWVKANYRLSTEYGFKALRVFENSQYTKEWVSSLLCVARTLTELGSYNNADQFIHQALALGKSSETMQAEAYREHSYLLAETLQLDSALYFTNKGIALYEKMGDTLNASILYGRKSRIYFGKKDYEQSRKYAFRSMLLDTLVGNYRGLGIAYFMAGQNDYAMHNTKNAERLLQHAIRINKDIGNLEWLVRSHEVLATLYLDSKKPELAARQLQLAGQYKDSLYNSEKSGQIQEMQSLYELEGKENTIKFLEQENALRQQEVKNQKLFLAFLLVGILMLILLLFFLTRLRRIQYKTNKSLEAKNSAIEQQKEEMQAQAEKLHQLNELKTKLLSVISHDLRGPISNLQSLLDLFTKKLMTADEFIMMSDKLKTNLNTTQRTLENLLNWALSQMDGIKTDMRNIEVRACIEEASKLMEEIAYRKTIVIEKSIQDSLVYADPDQIQLVLRNIIHNGIKFSKTGDPIKITTSRENGYCRITVQDFGIGMSQKEIDMIIGSKEHFTKIGTEQEKGTGLGLLLCNEFIERNGGSLDIKSKAGQGTEVSFTLMLAIN